MQKWHLHSCCTILHPSNFNRNKDARSASGVPAEIKVAHCDLCLVVGRNRGCLPIIFSGLRFLAAHQWGLFMHVNDFAVIGVVGVVNPLPAFSRVLLGVKNIYVEQLQDIIDRHYHKTRDQT